MAYNEGMVNTISAPAGADLSGKQFYGVALVNDTSPAGVKAVVGTAGKAMAGVLQNNPLSGQAACIQYDAISKVAISANQAVTGGTTFLELDTGGTFKPVGTGAVVAQAVTSCPSAAVIQIVSALILGSNAPTA